MTQKDASFITFDFCTVADGFRYFLITQHLQVSKEFHAVMLSQNAVRAKCLLLRHFRPGLEPRVKVYLQGIGARPGHLPETSR